MLYAIVTGGAGGIGSAGNGTGADGAGGRIHQGGGHGVVVVALGQASDLGEGVFAQRQTLDGHAGGLAVVDGDLGLSVVRAAGVVPLAIPGQGELEIVAHA